MFTTMPEPLYKKNTYAVYMAKGKGVDTVFVANKGVPVQKPLKVLHEGIGITVK